MRGTTLAAGCLALVLISCALAATPTPTPAPTPTPEPVEECHDYLSDQPLLGESGHRAGGVLLSQFTAPEGGWRITRVGLYVLGDFRGIEVVLYDESQKVLVRAHGGGRSDEGWTYVEIPETAPIVRGGFYAGLVYIAPLIGRDDNAEGGHSYFIDPNGVWGRWSERAPEFDLPPNGEWAIQVCALSLGPAEGELGMAAER